MIDLLVIGGGVNGAGIARDAAGRGLSVLLCEKDDLAEGTSSRSGKLVHGGLRYLEYHEFRLVREALIEREVLLRAAPHIIWPMRFVLPHSPEQRPAWLIRLGLLLYDHLGGRKILPATRALDLRRDPEGRALAGAAAIEGNQFGEGSMMILERGADVPLRLEPGATGIICGGTAMDGPRRIEWNFVSSDPERIEAAKRDWATAAGTGGSERFPNVPGDADERIPLP